MFCCDYRVSKSNITIGSNHSHSPKNFSASNITIGSNYRPSLEQIICCVFHLSIRHCLCFHATTWYWSYFSFMSLGVVLVTFLDQHDIGIDRASLASTWYWLLVVLLLHRLDIGYWLCFPYISPIMVLVTFLLHHPDMIWLWFSCINPILVIGHAFPAST